MKRYTMSWAAANEHKPEHPERTARRNATRDPMGGDVVFQVWPSRGAMLATIHMQERRERDTIDWRPCVKEFASA